MLGNVPLLQYGVSMHNLYSLSDNRTWTVKASKKNRGMGSERR